MSKKLSFFGLRDSYGTTQLVADARSCGPELLAAMRDVPEESTVLIEGVVRQRPEAQRRDVRLPLGCALRLTHQCRLQQVKLKSS